MDPFMGIALGGLAVVAAILWLAFGGKRNG